MLALYISHPEVVIDPAIPTPNWGLSEIGFARAQTFAARELLPKNMRIVSSTETKALDLAAILAKSTGSSVQSNAAFGENDRSSTGFLSPEQFDAHVAKLFGEPEESVAGWERAVDAQARIVKAVETALAHHDPSQPIIFTGHGCVGTLLKCHIGNRPITLDEDQRQSAHPGGGNLFQFELADKRLVCDWTAMEDWTGF